MEETSKPAGDIAFASPRARERLAEVAETYSLELVVLFGSQATGVAGPGSDTDLAVRSSRGIFDAFDLLELQEVLGQALRCNRADLVDLACADPLLLRRVFLDAIPLYQRGGAFERERLRAFHRYEDYRPYLRLERSAVRRRLGIDDR